ncbi:DUF4397 domain-containing protein [Yimella sp. cx-51]|uniref:DUF4397 domain-containing protein n=1 Tax=Yimella sp. cx-51 TaxID=2770551 RepID=UPI00165E32F5|nr:DUF4397 domain-containing protein [Yimella sp. cx-51]MBC9956573.1 DUF4397 domain-containing protein [Yimella sp. cx-51]MBD2760424.1 DUF4397 domain-containing protein [Yimella sp. cx-573]QTH38326.1 DUF4397 domain-containing protein [Yimella sp. cx-51]
MNLARIVAAGVGVTGAIALSPTLAHAADAPAAKPAMVSVLHAVPGATVDVYANGKELLPDFKPGTLTDPVSLPAGEYDLKVVAPNAGADGKAIIEANDVKVPAGANITVVAHLSADGKPMLTPYVNDTSALAAGKARVTVRHTAAAPAVDVRANQAVAFKNLVNPKEAMADLAAGNISADVVLAGTQTVAIGPADLSLKAGTNTIVYAWGSAADKNLKLAVQTIDGLGGMPGGVPAGTGGQATAGDSSSAGVIVLGAAGAGALAMLATRRRSRTERA